MLPASCLKCRNRWLARADFITQASFHLRLPGQASLVGDVSHNPSRSPSFAEVFSLFCHFVEGWRRGSFRDQLSKNVAHFQFSLGWENAGSIGQNVEFFIGVLELELDFGCTGEGGKKKVRRGSRKM